MCLFCLYVHNSREESIVKVNESESGGLLDGLDGDVVVFEDAVDVLRVAALVPAPPPGEIDLVGHLTMATATTRGGMATGGIEMVGWGVFFIEKYTTRWIRFVVRACDAVVGGTRLYKSNVAVEAYLDISVCTPPIALYSCIHIIHSYIGLQFEIRE